MKDISIILDGTKPVFDESFIGLNRENLQKNIVFSFKDTFIEGNADLELQIGDEKGVITNIPRVGNTYVLPIKSSLLTEDHILMQLVIYETNKVSGNEIPIYKSEIIYMKVKESLNATGDIPTDYPTWTETLNVLYGKVEIGLNKINTFNISTETIAGGYVIYIRDTAGVTSTITLMNGTNGRGITSISKTSSSGNVDTYTILYTDNTTSTFEVTNSEVTDEEFAELERKVDYYKTTLNALPKITGTGTSITLNNTANSPMELELQPSELEQATTTGKNIRDIYNMSYVAGGSATVTKANGNITIAGTTASYASAQYTQADLKLEPNTTYTFSAKIVSTTNSSGSLVYVSPTMSDTGSQIWGSQVTANNRSVVTFTTPATISDSAWIGLYTGGTSNTAVFTDIQLEIGSSATDFEPYTGGIASPNPDYPQDIHVISGNNTIKVINKNLLSKSQTLVGRTISNNTRYGMEFTINGDFYISQKTPVTTTLYLYRKSGDTYTFVNALWTSPHKVTNTNDTYFIADLETYSEATAQTHFNNENIMLSYTNDTYIEHKEQDFSITLGDLEYCKIGTYADEFIKATNETGLTAGKWYLKKNIPKEIIDGTFGDYNSTSDWFYFSTPNIINGTSALKCTHFSYVTYNSFTSSSHPTGMTTRPSGSPTVLRIHGYSSKSEYTTFLENNNPILYYASSVAEYILLNDTLQEELENIYNYALGYEEQTNILQVNNDLPFVINASAIKIINS